MDGLDVFAAAVVPELLPVVRGKHDDRLVEPSAPLEVVEEVAERCVDLRDLAVVQGFEVTLHRWVFRHRIRSQSARSVG